MLPCKMRIHCCFFAVWSRDSLIAPSTMVGITLSKISLMGVLTPGDLSAYGTFVSMQTGESLLISHPMHPFSVCWYPPSLICCRQHDLCRVGRFVGPPYQQTVWLGKISDVDCVLHLGCFLLLSFLPLSESFAARYSRLILPHSIHFHTSHCCYHRGWGGRWLHPKGFSRHKLEAITPHFAAELPVCGADGWKPDIEHKRNPDGRGD